MWKSGYPELGKNVLFLFPDMSASVGYAYDVHGIVFIMTTRGQLVNVFGDNEYKTVMAVETDYDNPESLIVNHGKMPAGTVWCELP